MHQIRFPLGLSPRPTGGAYSTPSISLLYLRGLLLRKGGEGREEGKGEEKRGQDVLQLWSLDPPVEEGRKGEKGKEGSLG